MAYGGAARRREEPEDEGQDAKAAPDDPKKEQRLLTILKAQKAASVGFENDTSLRDDRARALDYYKGEHKGAVEKDLPALENRSKVVSTDTADTIERWLPSVIEVFTAGDDALTFKPLSEEDMEAAQQETDYVRHVIFQQNPGWWLFYEAFKDAAISKMGVFHYYWDGQPEYQEEETVATETQVEEMLQQGVELIDMEPTGTFALYSGQRFPLFKATLRRTVAEGHVCIKVVAPENFTWASETGRLPETYYCAMKARVLKQDLIADGYDENKVKSLRKEDETDDDERDARDTAQESEDADDNPGDPMLEFVDIVTHYIRLDLEETGSPQIWRVVTGNGEKVILEKEKRARIEFAAITPYPMPHRLLGQSIADKTIPKQMWKTSITRGANDHIYFANNQRQEVKKSGIVAGTTLEQLVDNTPGAPVVTEDGNSLKAIQNGSMGFDPLAYLEYINTTSEEATGSARNSQGLKPDTLHDTKGGAEILIGAAQKRDRMMARLFAETGIRDLFVGVHDLVRSNATMQDTIRLRNKWVPINPSSWQRRKDVVIDIGVGSGGRDRDLMGFREYGTLLTTAATNPKTEKLVTPENAYAFIDAYGDKLGIKGQDRFITDPAQQPEEPQEGPTPEQMAAQAEAQVAMAKAQSEMEVAKFKATEQAKLEREKAAAQLQLKRDEAALEAELAQKRAEDEAQLAIIKMQGEFRLAQEKARLEAQIGMVTAANPNLPDNRAGGSLAE